MKRMLVVLVACGVANATQAVEASMDKDTLKISIIMKQQSSPTKLIFTALSYALSWAPHQQRAKIGNVQEISCAAEHDVFWLFGESDLECGDKTGRLKTTFWISKGMRDAYERTPRDEDTGDVCIKGSIKLTCYGTEPFLKPLTTPLPERIAITELFPWNGVKTDCQLTKRREFRKDISDTVSLWNFTVVLSLQRLKEVCFAFPPQGNKYSRAVKMCVSQPEPWL